MSESPMRDVITSLPQTISASAQSKLAFLSMCCIVSAIVANSLFRTASDKTKLIAFTLIFVPVIFVGAYIIHDNTEQPTDVKAVAAPPSQEPSDPGAVPTHKKESPKKSIPATPEPPAPEVTSKPTPVPIAVRTPIRKVWVQPDAAPARQSPAPARQTAVAVNPIAQAQATLPMQQQLHATDDDDGTLVVTGVKRELDGILIQTELHHELGTGKSYASAEEMAVYDFMKRWACGMTDLVAMLKTGQKFDIDTIYFDKHGNQALTGHIKFDCQVAYWSGHQ